MLIADAPYETLGSAAHAHNLSNLIFNLAFIGVIALATMAIAVALVVVTPEIVRALLRKTEPGKTSYRFRLGPCRFLIRVGYQGNRVAERTRSDWRCRAAHREDVCVRPPAALAVELRAAGLQVGSCRAKCMGVLPAGHGVGTLRVRPGASHRANGDLGDQAMRTARNGGTVGGRG